MIAATANTWLAIAGLAIGAVSALIALREYRLKAQAHRAELDVRLAEAFARLVPVANARSDVHFVSEAAVARLLTDVDPANVEEVKRRLGAAIVCAPLGYTTQMAAIASIGELARRHDLLGEPAAAALSDLERTLQNDPHASGAVAAAQRRAKGD